MWGHLKTVLSVILLSSLIWVFTERQVTQSGHVDVKVVLTSTPRDSDPMLRFCDENGRPLDESFVIVDVKIQGTASRIQQIRYEDPRFEITLSVDKLGYDPGGAVKQDITVRVMALLEGNLRYENSVLWVSDPNPEVLHVQASQVVLRDLDVKVYDRTGAVLSLARVSPATVSAYVLSDQTVEASLILSPEQQIRAAKGPVSTMCKIVMPDRTVEREVQVELPEGASPWSDVKTIRSPRYYIAMPPSMVGNYRVEIDDDLMLKDPINYHGSALAVSEFAEADYHLLLEIKADDKPGVEIFRTLRYLLPDEHREFEIVDERKRPVTFHLVEIPSSN